MREPRYPVTQVQEGIAGLELLAPGTAAATTAELIHSPVPLSAELVDRALQQCLTEQPLLRVRLVDCEARPYLETVSQARTEVREITVTSMAAAREEIAAARMEPLDPRTGQMTRALLLHTPEGDKLLHLAHHLVLDGMGAGIYLRRFAAVYSALAAGSALPQPATTIGVEEMARADGEMRRSARHRETVQRWQQWREELPELGHAPERTAAVSTPARVSKPIPHSITVSLPELAARTEVTVPDLVVAVLAGLVPADPDTAAVTVGVAAAGRLGPGRVAWAAVPSTAVTVLPTRVPDGAATLQQACSEVAMWRRRAADGGGITQEQLLAWDRAEGCSRMPAVQLNVLPFDAAVTLLGQRAPVQNICAGPTPQWTLTVRGPWGGRGEVQLELDYNPTSVSVSEAQALLQRAIERLQAATQLDPHTSMAALPRCTAAEAQWLREREGNPHKVHPRTLYEAFAQGSAAAAARTVLSGPSMLPPQQGSTAAKDESASGAAPELALSGAEVWHHSLALAAGLAARGIGKDDVVAVSLPRSPQQVLLAHALLHIGAVYLPIHPELPAARCDDMCAQAEPALFVDAPLYAALEQEALNGGNPPLEHSHPPELDDPAYILFTSGSTGRPKGVVVTHRAIDNRLQWMQHQCALQAGERVLYKTPCSFDVHIWELYWPLRVGGHLVVAPDGAERDPRQLAELMAACDIGVVHFVPGMLEAVVSTPAVKRIFDSWRGLRLLVCSGEALSDDLAARAHAVTGCWPLNLYGPTEAAIDVTVWDSAVPSSGADVPLGRPVWNTICTVRDAFLRRVPPGEVGTLYLGGPQLAVGYLQRPELTAAAFRTTTDGERLYDTGDLAVWDADGLLRYRGRAHGDRQVKIRGQRIELEEVEQVIADCPGVHDAICTLSDHAGSPAIVAHILAAADTDITSVQEFAEQRLTVAMRPVNWQRYDAFPTTGNGKVDRAALRAPATSHEIEATRVDAYHGGDVAVSIIIGCFATVLGTPVSAHDSFFALGGDSLACIRLLADIDAELGWTPRVAEFMAALTPYDVAAAYHGLHNENSATAEASATTWLRNPADEQIAPLVFLPPAGGLCWPYLPLLAHLHQQRPVLAVLAPQVLGTQVDPRQTDSSDGLSAWQHEQIRHRIPTGKFHVAGWSSGGANAQHLAAKHPDEVLSVTLLDSYPAETWQSRTPPTNRERFTALLRMGGIDEHNVDELPRTQDEAIELLLQHQSPLAALGADTVAACVRSILAQEELTRVHATASYAGPVLHIGAARSRSDALDATHWQEFLAHLDMIEMPGTHVDLVRRARADAVAGAIEAHLCAAESAVAKVPIS